MGTNLLSAYLQDDVDKVLVLKIALKLDDVFVVQQAVNFDLGAQLLCEVVG